MSRGLRLGLAAVAAVLVAVSALGVRITSGPGLPTGDRMVAGLDGSVEILWDEMGIPQVWATTPRDALFTQGYLHATQRLWQMEMFRRVARGRLSEIFGEATLQTDRFLRTLGLDRAAEAGIPLLDPETRELLESYARGVNAALEGWGGLLPPEFLVLGAEPEPYSLGDVLALEKIMAWDLADYGSSLDLAAAFARLGEEGFRRIRPRYPLDGISILESAGVEEGPVPASDGMALRPESVPGSWRLALVEASRRPAATGFDFVGAVGSVRASNAWVVGPGRSASGAPLVANDMHLSLDQPTLWYLMGLHAPGLDVVGMTLPGTAGVVAGRSGAVAWGFTNAMLDDTELFVERVDPGSPDRYLVPGGSEAFVTREEVILVKGGAADTLVVRSTRHGPVITEVEPRAGDELLALRWVALDPSTTASAILGMNRARTAEEFLGALEGFSDPHQNVVFADTAGDWGYWMAGRIPDRPGGRPPLVPVPGWTGDHDWRGYLPFAQHPHALDPPSGFVATANNRQSWSPTGDRVNGGVWASPYRAERITQLLRGRSDHDIESMHRIQLDVTSLLALELLPYAVDAFRKAGAQEEARSLEAWDGAGTLESGASTLFHGWYDGVRRGLRREIYGEEGGYLSYAAVADAIRGGLPDSLASEAVAAALERGGAPWGEAHRLSLDHPLAGVPMLRFLLGFGRREIPRAGTPHTVNVAEYGYDATGFPVRSGPSQRHVTDLADLDGGGFVLPGGQSGYPRGRHAFDQLPLWLEGGLVPLPVSREGAEARAVKRLILSPGAAQGG